jgi:urease accessory protein
MPAPLGLDRMARAGTGHIRFSCVGSRTVVTQALATSPLKLLNPRHAGTAACVYLATYGGGLVGGDAISIDVDVEAGAAALLATQASTKVYRSDRRATQRLHARVGNGSLLALLPDPVTCFAGARYVQEQEIRLEGSASLVMLDWLTAGRVSFGERWRFEEYASRTRLWRDGHLLWADGLTLLPQDGEIAGRLGRFNCLALAVLTGPALQATAVRLAGSLQEAPVPRQADILLGASPIGDEGVLVRVAGRSTEQVAAVLQQHLGALPSLLGDDPRRVSAHLWSALQN